MLIGPFWPTPLTPVQVLETEIYVAETRIAVFERMEFPCSEGPWKTDKDALLLRERTELAALKTELEQLKRSSTSAN